MLTQRMKFRVDHAQLSGSFERFQPSGRIEHPDVAEYACFIIAHLSARLEVDDIVAVGSISRRTLERRFRSQIGMSIRETVTWLRVEIARQMLVGSERRIVDIAFDVGFADSSQMSRTFRRLLGRSPSSFREADHDAQRQDTFLTGN